MINRAIVLAILLAAGPAAAAAPTLSVYPANTKLGLSSNALRVMFEKPLAAHARIVPRGVLKRATGGAGVEEMLDPTRAAQIAQSIELTHLLVLVPERRNGGGSLKVVLVDVAAGSAALDHEYDVGGKRLNQNVTTQIVSEVAAILTAAPPPAPPPAESPVVEALEAEAAEAYTEAPPAAVAPSAPPPIAVARAPASHPATVEDTTVEVIDAAMVSEPKPTEVTETTPKDEGTAPRWRPAARVMLGLALLRRTARLGSANPVRGVACYCEDGLGSTPIYPSFYVSLDIYPWAYEGTGEIVEGLGVHGEVFYAQVSTLVDRPDDVIVSTSMAGATGGVQFRYVWWDDLMAPDATVRAGYRTFKFPLHQGPFPGVAYGGPYVGAEAAVPVLPELLSLQAGGSYQFVVTTGEGTSGLGELRSSGAFRVEGGARLSFSVLPETAKLGIDLPPAEVHLVFRYERFDSGFDGPFDVDGRARLERPELSDELIGGYVTVGVAF